MIYIFIVIIYFFYCLEGAVGRIGYGKDEECYRRYARRYLFCQPSTQK